MKMRGVAGYLPIKSASVDVEKSQIPITLRTAPESLFWKVALDSQRSWVANSVR